MGEYEYFIEKLHIAESQKTDKRVNCHLYRAGVQDAPQEMERN